MALIECPECGRQVSTGASACPGCGLDHPGAVAAERFADALSAARIRATTRASFDAFGVFCFLAILVALAGKLAGVPPEEFLGAGVIVAAVFFVIRRSRLIRRNLNAS